MLTADNARQLDEIIEADSISAHPLFRQALAEMMQLRSELAARDAQERRAVAEMVAEEREACAQIADAVIDAVEPLYEEEGGPEGGRRPIGYASATDHERVETAVEIAAAIRNRSQ